MKKTAAVLLIGAVMLTCFAHVVFSGDLIKRFAHPGQRQKLYYSGILTGKTYYIAGTGDGRPESLDESYGVKTRETFASIQQSLQMAGLDSPYLSRVSRAANMLKSHVLQPLI